MSSRFGVVVIGRNEGDRLLTCLDSVSGNDNPIVYVDSGSTDGSVSLAQSRGVEVVALDMSIPFTAARARNKGFQRLLALSPEVNYVQFVDGDCEVVAGWLEAARLFLDAHREVAVVCGRLHERFPHRSVYNLLCDIEWDTPAGEAKACGGNAMMQVDAFASVEGFRADLIAGEEPELCVRLRAEGWKVWRLEQEMALHDAAMAHFGQWWRRARRGGYAFANGHHLHGAPPEFQWVAETRRIWFWGLGVPLSIFLGLFFFGYVGLLLLCIYPAQIARLALLGSRTNRENWWRAFFLVLGKYPELSGLMGYWLDYFMGRQAQIIEHK